MRFNNWSKLSWWQKTRTIALAFAGLGIVSTFLLTISLAGILQTNAMQSFAWITFSVFPLLIVVAIASFAHLQSQTNLRSGNAQNQMKKPGKSN